MGRIKIALTRADKTEIHPDLYTAVVMMAVLPCAIGLAILLGGPQRFSSGVWEMQRLVAPWWVWGWTFLLGGMLLGREVICGNIDRICHLLMLASVMFFSLSLGLLGSSLRNPDAAWTGTIVYSWVALMQLAVRSSMPGPGERP